MKKEKAMDIIVRMYETLDKNIYEAKVTTDPNNNRLGMVMLEITALKYFNTIYSTELAPLIQLYLANNRNNGWFVDRNQDGSITIYIYYNFNGEED